MWAQIIYEWQSKDSRYRLIKVPKLNGYVVERESSDATGAPKWDVIHRWAVGPYSDDATCWLTTELALAINKLVAVLAASKNERRG